MNPAGPLFHGGAPGKRPGDTLSGGHSRPTMEGCVICEARENGLTVVLDGEQIDPPTGHPDRLYLTTWRPYARFYASMYGRGDVYEVQPIGDLVESTEDPFPSWTAAAVTIRRVEAVSVTLSDKERRLLYRRWGEADRLSVPLLARNQPLSASERG